MTAPASSTTTHEQDVSVADEAEEFLAKIRLLAEFYEEGLLSEQEVNAAQEKLLKAAGRDHLLSHAAASPYQATRGGISGLDPMGDEMRAP